MEDLLTTGKTRAIGVCNYSVRYLEELMSEATIAPAVNQIENHPYLPQNDIVDYCKAREIHVTSYSPLGSTGSPLGLDPSVMRIAEKHGVSFSTVLLSYHRKSLRSCDLHIADEKKTYVGTRSLRNL